jgi:hypothetical protein
MAVQAQPGPFDALDAAIKELEFKFTALPDEEDKVEALLKGARVVPIRRRVYFFDTLELALAEQDLFVRARVTEHDDDESTVKLRPLPDTGVPAVWKKSGFEIEADVVGSTPSASIKLEDKPEPGRIEKVASDDKPALSKLFNKKQEAIIKDALPRGTKLDDLKVLGPIDARKWELPADILPPYELCVEEWSLPDASRFLELSFKAQRVNGERALQAFTALLGRLKIGPEGDPDPKTRNALEFFRDWLR